MGAELRRLRSILEGHPRLDDGVWWAQLGGFHMNVHKLLENALFECELYLGYALTFKDAHVRQMAEQNLAGCYQKRLLEAARFMWMAGAQLMMDGEWRAAVDLLKRAAAQKDGWGWAVNYGDIWLSEAAARIVCGVDGLSIKSAREESESNWVAYAKRLVDKSSERTDEAGVFGSDGHPWAVEIRDALNVYAEHEAIGADVTDWIESLNCGRCIGVR